MTHFLLHKWPPLPLTSTSMATPYTDSSQPDIPQISTRSSGGTDYAAYSYNDSTYKLKKITNPIPTKNSKKTSQHIMKASSQAPP